MVGQHTFTFLPRQVRQPVLLLVYLSRFRRGVSDEPTCGSSEFRGIVLRVGSWIERQHGGVAGTA